MFLHLMSRFRIALAASGAPGLKELQVEIPVEFVKGAEQVTVFVPHWH